MGLNLTSLKGIQDDAPNNEQDSTNTVTNGDVSSPSEISPERADSEAAPKKVVEHAQKHANVAPKAPRISLAGMGKSPAPKMSLSSKSPSDTVTPTKPSITVPSATPVERVSLSERMIVDAPPISQDISDTEPKGSQSISTIVSSGMVESPEDTITIRTEDTPAIAVSDTPEQPTWGTTSVSLRRLTKPNRLKEKSTEMIVGGQKIDTSTEFFPNVDIVKELFGDTSALFSFSDNSEPDMESISKKQEDAVVETQTVVSLQTAKSAESTNESSTGTLF